MRPYALELNNIVKKYGMNTVLNNIDFDLREGEVHVLLGANGAGKSTLMKIISGVTHYDEGELRVFGQPLRFQNPSEAAQAGVAYVAQEPSLINTLPVAENLFLGKEPKKKLFWIDQSTIYKQAERMLEQLDFPIDVRKMTAELTAAEKKMVEIGRSITAGHSRILILDEPTATLTYEEAKQLFKLIHRLKAKGVGIIYITHHLDELNIVGDRVTVLRDGKKAGTFAINDVDEKQLIVTMMGEAVQTAPKHREQSKQPVVLDLREISPDPFLDSKKCYARKSEILVFFGLTGSGRTELLRTLAGRSGNKNFNKNILPKLKQKGITYIPDDRKNKGILANRNIVDNIAVSNLDKHKKFKILLDTKNIEQSTESLAAQLNIKLSSVQQNIKELSGGNQQKVLLARAIFSEADVIVIDDPTVGVDVNARAQIHQLLFALSREGKTLIIGTSDENEACMIADRIYVLFQGRIVKELTGSDITEENVLSYASGLSHQGGE